MINNDSLVSRYLELADVLLTGKPLRLKGNNNLTEEDRPLALRMSREHPELWQRYVTLCEKQNATTRGEKTMTREEMAEAVAVMPVEMTRGMTRPTCFASITRTRAGFDVRCGWIVNEAYDDDYDSCTDQPFGAPQPWVGRKQSFTDVESAMTCLDSYREDVLARLVPKSGDVIGSVIR